jgi:ATP-dependent Clp protease ATP-binding subunit ClpA
MFERYTESARRVLFFARYEVTQHGGLTIEPEHVLLGVVREAPAGVGRFARTGSPEMLRQLLTGPDAGPPERVSTSVEIPFSAATKAVLERAHREADALPTRFIAPEHLVLGILLEESGRACRALHDAGVDADAIREFLRTAPDEARDRDSSSGPRPGMVVRTWKGVVKPGLADEYVRHLKTETFPALRHLGGHQAASILRREVEDGTEFLITTVWRSLDDIKAFAGDDVTSAVLPPAAQAMMVRYDDRAVHFELVF